VVDVAPRLVVKQVADAAVVASHALSAAAAGAAHRLPRAAQHARHLAHGVAVQPVVARLVVAQPAIAVGDDDNTLRYTT
jgi:hypothetical protein